MRFRFLVIIAGLSFWFGCGELKSILDQSGGGALTQGEIVLGLKEALNQGVDAGVNFLSARDGFFRSDYRILLPEEARAVTDRLKLIPGFSQVEDILIERINRAAEDAVGKAKPIFVQAIKDMTIRDGLDILMGPDNAATQYLHRNTYDPLYHEFQPIIFHSLNQFNVIDYWADAVNTYNQIPLVRRVNPRLDDYIAHQALNALFDLVREEELKIRRNISFRTTDILKKVFARQDANRQ